MTESLTIDEFEYLTLERLHEAATWRYWNDAEFHARCEVVLRKLGGEAQMTGREAHRVLYALAVDDVAQDRV